jgi:hypothetical protein
MIAKLSFKLILPLYKMDEPRGTLLPLLLDLMYRYEEDDSPSTNQLLLRVIRVQPPTLTDGFFSIEVQNLSDFHLEPHTFLRVTDWTISTTMNNLTLVLRNYEKLGHDYLSEFQIKPIKENSEVKALLTNVYRKQLKATIREKSLEEIREMISSIESARRSQAVEEIL